jgi:hypothetical protein
VSKEDFRAIPPLAQLGAKTIAISGLVVFALAAVASSVVAFHISAMVGVLWILIALPVGYRVAYIATRATGNAFLYFANPSGRSRPSSR